MSEENEPQVVFDEPKRIRNLATHGMDFRDVKFQFFDEALILKAKRNRLKAIGMFRDGTIAVVFAMLGTEAVSVISMRPASRMERRLYDAYTNSRSAN